MAEFKKVKPEDLKPGPIRHGSLTPEVLEQVDLVFKMIGRWLSGPREVFETNLMRDAHPEREILVWLRIAYAWHKYHVRHLRSRVQDDDTETRLVGALVTISCGAQKTDQKLVTGEEHDRLLECYTNPKPDDPVVVGTHSVTARVDVDDLIKKMQEPKDVVVEIRQDGTFKATCKQCQEKLLVGNTVHGDLDLVWHRCPKCERVSFSVKQNLGRDAQIAGARGGVFTYEIYFMRDLPPQLQPPTEWRSD
jgi:hypothetical protein